MCLIWCSPNPRTWKWGNIVGVTWIKEEECTAYLGIPLGYRVPQAIRNKRLITKVRDSLAYWCTKRLSQAGRLLISNQVILASLWYLASCSDISGKTFRKAKALVRNFLWANKVEGQTTHAKIRVELSNSTLHTWRYKNPRPSNAGTIASNQVTHTGFSTWE